MSCPACNIPAAVELLALASIYDILYWVQQAEVTLKNQISSGNCFAFLTIADHHKAQQLRNLSMHYIVNAFNLLKGTEDFDNVSPELQREILQARTVFLKGQA